MSEQQSQGLRGHSPDDTFLTLNWSWEQTHCHQLMHLYTKPMSVFMDTHITHGKAHSFCFGAAAKKPVPCSVPRGALVYWNTQPVACSVALPNPGPVTSSAQMLWQRPRGGPAGLAWCCDRKITPKNNKSKGICFVVTDAETSQHRVECKHTHQRLTCLDSATLIVNLFF